MPDNAKQTSGDVPLEKASENMHSEAWWIRLLDGDLTSEEQRRWERHLSTCSKCQREWAALVRVDEVMRAMPEPPKLSQQFTDATVSIVRRKQRLRRLLGLLGGGLIVALVSVLVFAYIGSAYAALEHSLGVLISARQILFRSLIQTWVSLIVTWKSILPFAIGLTVVTYLLIMPNGLMVTLGLLWLSRRRRSVSTTPA
ncbi:MAG: anti-sigma factor family protein [Anaerolineae bacterium]